MSLLSISDFSGVVKSLLDDILLQFPSTRIEINHEEVAGVECWQTTICYTYPLSTQALDDDLLKSVFKALYAFYGLCFIHGKLTHEGFMEFMTRWVSCLDGLLENTTTGTSADFSVFDK